MSVVASTSNPRRGRALRRPSWRVPLAAEQAWRRLGDELSRRPPPPCEDPAVRDAWWSTDPHQAADAVYGCSRCPVTQACGAYALAAVEPHGVWGGTTPDQRRAGGQVVLR